MSKLKSCMSLVLFFIPLVLFVSACKEESKITKKPESVSKKLTPDCYGTHCGAFDDMYTGRDIGVWTYTNNSNSVTELPIKILNTQSRDLTLMFTNISTQRVPMTNITLTPDQTTLTEHSYRHDVEALNHKGHLSRLESSQKLVKTLHSSSRKTQTRIRPKATYAEGDHRDWFVHVDFMEQRSTTLIKKIIRAGRRTVNIWVQDSEYGPGKMTDAFITQMMDSFVTGPDAGMDHVAKLAGDPWGPHEFADLIPSDNGTDLQELDIVFVNFIPDGEPFGLMGYFWNLNNFLANPGNGTEESNEALALFMDTETVYLAAHGVQIQTATLGHEMTHMVNFYNRGIVKDNTFPIVLEETSALMMEDVLYKFLGSSQPSVEYRYLDWLAQEGINCSFFDWNDEFSDKCFSYSLGLAVGGYLNRHLGLKFYMDLLQNNDLPTQTGYEYLNHILKINKAPSFEKLMPRFATNYLVFDNIHVPAFYGLPQSYDSGYIFPKVVGDPALRKWPKTLPQYIEPFGSFPVLRRGLTQDYEETVSVPPKTTLTVIVQ